MNTHEKLQLIFNASELALLNGSDRNAVRKAAQELAQWIDLQLKPAEPPAPPTAN